MINKSDEIKFLARGEIDSSWWNTLINNSASPLIYAEAEYLDFMSPGWFAFYHHETESVMPFPLKKKFGISYSLQPMFTQQLGIFSKNEISELLVQKFIGAAKEKASLIDLHFNYNNSWPGAETKTNFIIPLNQPFLELRKSFRKDLIQKSINHKLNYLSGNLEETFRFHQKYSLDKTNLTKKVISKFYLLSKHFEKKGCTVLRKVVNPPGKSGCMALFLKDEGRIYYILSASSPEGRKVDANAYLLHEVLHEFSESHLIFDFEGSEIPGVKFFFEKFSPQLQSYPILRINNLSPLMKKIIHLRKLFR